MHCSLVYQFEHSGKVRRAWFKFGFENLYSSLLSGSASFLCVVLMSPQRTKQYSVQIEYFTNYSYHAYTSSRYYHFVCVSFSALCRPEQKSENIERERYLAEIHSKILVHNNASKSADRTKYYIKNPTWKIVTLRAEATCLKPKQDGD